MTSSVIFCPDCKKPSKVVDTVKRSDGSIHRIRSCKSCVKRWETVEILVEESVNWSLPRGRDKKRR